MRISILISLGALLLAGCAVDATRNASINHIVAKCAPGASPLTADVQRCMDHEANVVVASNHCRDWKIAADQVERCQRELQKYVAAFTACRAGRSLPADRPQIVACARARQPVGYNWITTHHA